MNFRFTEEQEMIRDSVADFLAGYSDSKAVRSAMESDAGYDAALWQRICEEMYWQAVTIPEQYGGLGLGYVELAVIQEQMGRSLLCAPFYSSVCLATNALVIAATEQQKETYLRKIAAGEMTATLAWMGDGMSWGSDAVSATWREHENTYELDGELRYVVDCETADMLIVAARKADSVGSDDIRLFLFPADTKGVERESVATMDQTRRLGSIRMANVSLPADACFGSGEELESILYLAQIALAAEQVGGAQQVLDMAVEYSLERRQFDRPIAGFQAIKHKAADMMMKTECSRSVVYYAACIADEALQGGALADELAEAASIAKASCSESYFFSAGSAMQIFGGVGFTWEYDVHLYFKRARATEAFLGNADAHREKLATMLLD